MENSKVEVRVNTSPSNSHLMDHKEAFITHTAYSNPIVLPQISLQLLSLKEI